MTSSPSARYKVQKQGQGDNTNLWGSPLLNNALETLDRGSKGYEALAMTGDTTLSWTNYSTTNSGQVSILKLTGSLSSAANLVVPSVEWVWDLIWNTTGQTITVKTSAGTGVAIPNGRKVGVFCDATDCYFAVPNYLGDDITEVNDRDLMDKAATEAAIATASLPATAGTVLVSLNDTTAGYLGTKVNVTGSGAASVTPSITNPGASEVKTFAISVGDVGLTDGGLQTASFSAAVGNFYVCPAGGTITLPAHTGSRRKIGIAVFGSGTTLLSGTVNGVTSTTAYALLGDQSVILTDSDATRGWV